MAREVGEIFYEIRLQLSKKCGTEVCFSSQLVYLCDSDILI
jgi:hypothetical protein